MKRRLVQTTLWEEDEIEQAGGRVCVGFFAHWTFSPPWLQPEFMCESCAGTTSDIPRGPFRNIYRAPDDPKRVRCCACKEAF